MKAEVEEIQGPTPTIEDYLWMIFTLQRDGEEVIGARLAELLGVSAPTVTVTLRRMIRDGWISLNEKKHVLLTEEGKQAASSVLRRHMLVEWLLFRMLDVPWSNLHDEAHKLEHYISEDVEERLTAYLQDPKVCPHGNPVPGHEDQVKDWVPLTEARVGSTVIIRRLHEHIENKLNLMHFLEENHIVPGNAVHLEEILPFNQIITLSVDGKNVSLGLQMARYIFVEFE
jgi:DtxR family Mn-dependent transcriptional regulator